MSCCVLGLLIATGLGAGAPSAAVPDETVRRLVKDLGDKDTAVRRKAAGALVKRGKDARAAVPALVRALNDADESVRADCARALGKVGAPAVPALVEAAGDKEVRTRRGAVLALGWMGPTAKAAVPTLVAALRDKEEVRQLATVSLARVGAPAVPALLKAFKSADAATHGPATAVLVRIGEPSVRGLAEALQDKAVETRRRAVLALGVLGPKAKAAAPALKKALDDADLEVRIGAGVALKRTESKEKRGRKP
jgi:HEAT repeat protein